MKKEDLEVRGFEVMGVGYPEGVTEGQVPEGSVTSDTFGVTSGDPEGVTGGDPEGGREEKGEGCPEGTMSNPVLDEIARRGVKGKPVSVLELIDARSGHREPGSVSVLDVIRERRFGMK